MAHKIWHTLQSDKSQRELLLNAAEPAFAVRCPGLYADLKWAINQADKLGIFRNDTAHTPIWFMGIGGDKRYIYPDMYSSRSQSIQRLMAAPTATTWRKVRGDLYVLATCVEAIQAHFQTGPLEALRARPPLQALPKTPATKTPKDHQLGSKGRKPPPGS